MLILLIGGRVVDPGTGLDTHADVLVRDGSVAAVAPKVPVPSGAIVIDVTGLVVGPGFVDLHSHVHSIAGHRLQAMDGVTTAFDLEAGLMPVRRAYAEAARDGRPLNYGFSASWSAARSQVLLGVEPDAQVMTGLAILGDPRWQRTSSQAELTKWLSLLDRELSDGALGIGVLLGYAPRTEPNEFLQVARLAAHANVPTYTHVRELVEADPTTPIDGCDEIVMAAAETGAAMHHCHVNSTSRRHLDRVLATLERSQASGSRVTVETYPYGAGSTGVGAYFLAPERLGVWGLAPRNIVLVETGERIADLERLREVRTTTPGAECIVEFLDENDTHDQELVQRSIAFPDAIVASDAMPILWRGNVIDSREWPLPPAGGTHPRTAGTFAKTLRMMVREAGVWTWSEAFRRCAYLPSRILDEVAPVMRRKGHLGVGADADLVVLDPSSVTDAATYRNPTRPSIGVRHLLVGGEFVVRDGALQIDSLSGRAIRGEPGR